MGRLKIIVRGDMSRFWQTRGIPPPFPLEYGKNCPTTILKQGANNNTRLQVILTFSR